MSLATVAQQLFDLSAKDYSPTLVWPWGVEIQSAFLVDLATEISQVYPQPIRFDWLVRPTGMLQTQLCLWRANRLAARLHRDCESVTFQATAALARPDHLHCMVIGLAKDQTELPAWSKIVRVELSTA